MTAPSIWRVTGARRLGYGSRLAAHLASLLPPVPPLGVDRPVGLVWCLRMLACPRPPPASTLLLPLGVQDPPFAAGIGWFVDRWPLAMRAASAAESLEVRCLTVAGSPAAWGCRPRTWRSDAWPRWRLTRVPSARRNGRRWLVWWGHMDSRRAQGAVGDDPPRVPRLADRRFVGPAPPRNYSPARGRRFGGGTG